MAGNRNLAKAKDARQDEFYTRLSDIEKELRHYRRHFHGKTVLCNCDDPFESNFFKYFALNFNRLGLKKLMATCYSGSPITGTQLSLFGDDTEEERRTPYKAVVTSVRDATGNGGVEMEDVAELFKNGENTIERLEGTGSYDSPECLELLDEADIVVTNPPFSHQTVFRSVIDWVQAIFPKYRREMKGLPWGLFYNEHKDRVDLDPKGLEIYVSRLMADEDVTKKAGVYEYLLTGKERCLSIRAFDERMKRAAYERQGGVCPYCGQHFEFSEMHADHIRPWSKGGTTVADNCQMLCRDCNLRKSDD